MASALAFLNPLANAQGGLAGTGLTTADARAVAAQAKEIPCEKNAAWESKVFILRIKNGTGNSNAPREVRISFDSCSRFANQATDEERWFSDSSHRTGFAVFKRIGSDKTSVAFFDNLGEPAKLCTSAKFGKFSNNVAYKTGYSLENVHFKNLCGGADWVSDVQVIPLAF